MGTPRVNNRWLVGGMNSCVAKEVHVCFFLVLYRFFDLAKISIVIIICKDEYMFNSTQSIVHVHG